MSLADLTIVEAGRRLEAGEITSVDLTEAVLERATMTEAQLHCYLTIDRDGALESAAASDER
ncbi:MAG TPA: Asp-tRNA(Asn)/Glu-tRNA(Gln) amidotransferase subunit GatA, partial [Acidimicrobiia bacterium]|nr:Asp-tRNA(Asn)/Glu-tRNA(Gln) amidotransferase subunit GatA [Acidimicrobiia bacterium]